MSLDLSMGSSRTRTPVARETALATAAAPGTAGGSPTPFAPCGPTGDGTSIMRTSIPGS